MLDDLKKATATELGKIIPEVYTDVGKPSAEVVGKTAALLPRTIKAVLFPLEKWVVNKEFKLKELEAILEKKLANIPAEKIVEPEAYVAVPALQAISYSMDSEELRNLYANLLANSMNSDIKDSVHPAFVDIIKSLSPTDIRVFNFIMSKYNSQAVGCYYAAVTSKSKDSHSIFLRYLIAYNDEDIYKIESSIDNLIRTNLISSMDSKFSNKKYYNDIENCISYKAACSIASNIILEGNLDEFKFYETSLNSTTFGKDFYTICVKES